MLSKKQESIIAMNSEAWIKNSVKNYINCLIQEKLQEIQAEENPNTILRIQGQLRLLSDMLNEI